MTRNPASIILAAASLLFVAGCGGGGGGDANGLAQAVTGMQIYDDSCAGCHSLSTYDPAGDPDIAGADLTSLQGRFPADAPGHQGITLSANEVQGMHVWVNADFTGKEIYDDRCRSCHKLGLYDTNGSQPNLAGRNVMNAHHLTGVSTDNRQHLNNWVHTP